MPNGLDIISEQDFVSADSDTARGWNYRTMASITKQNILIHESMEKLNDQLEQSVLDHKNCPGRNYRPVVDKMLVAIMGLMGGFIAFFVAIKAKLIDPMTQ